MDWRHAGPLDEGTVKRRGVGVAEIGSDLADRIPGLGQAGQRHVAPQRILDGAETRPFLAQAAVDRAWRQVQAVTDVIKAEHGRQRGAQQVADANDHLPVTPVECGDLAGCAVEEAGQRRFVATDGQIEQVGIEAGDQRPDTTRQSRGEAGIRGEDQRVVGGMGRAAVGKDDAVERQAATGKSARQPVKHPEQPFESEDSPSVIRVVGQASALADKQFGVALVAPDSDG